MSRGVRVLAPESPVRIGSPPMRVLVVEDERDLATTVAQALRESGHAADIAFDGEEGLRLALTSSYDAVVLDLLLPKRPGLSVLREIRRARPKLPVLVLSALDRVEERVDGLDRGADDYLAKPFALSELLARVRALLRRGTDAVSSAVVSLGDLDVDLARRRATRSGRAIDLTGREWSILAFLAARPGAVVTRAEIGEHVIDRLFEPTSNAIDVSICGLRAKLGKPEMIRTVRGVGYRLDDAGVP